MGNLFSAIETKEYYLYTCVKDKYHDFPVYEDDPKKLKYTLTKCWFVKTQDEVYIKFIDPRDDVEIRIKLKLWERYYQPVSIGNDSKNFGYSVFSQNNINIGFFGQFLVITDNGKNRPLGILLSEKRSMNWGCELKATYHRVERTMVKVDGEVVTPGDELVLEDNKTVGTEIMYQDEKNGILKQIKCRLDVKAAVLYFLDPVTDKEVKIHICNGSNEYDKQTSEESYYKTSGIKDYIYIRKVNGFSKIVVDQATMRLMANLEINRNGSDYRPILLYKSSINDRYYLNYIPQNKE